MKKFFKLILFIVLGMILLTGCFNESVVPENDLNQLVTEDNSDNQNSSEEFVAGKGTLKIYMTATSEGYKDPPVFISGSPELNVPTNSDEQYLQVNISILKIEGHLAGDEEEGEDEGYWKDLAKWNDGGYEVDLLKLTDVSELLTSEQLEANKYTQLRIFLKKKASLIIEGKEDSIPLEIPSSAQTGIRLIYPFEIIEDKTTVLIINFDAENSIIKTGNEEYIMKPVISLSSETLSDDNNNGDA